MFRMKGVVPPMLIPFRENGEVDVEGLKVLTDFLKDKVHGLFITGSYGSGALMTEEERMLVTKTVIDAVDGKIPVVVHVGTADNRSAMRLTQFAVQCGASAVSAVGPYYYKHNEDSICGFYRDIVKAAQGAVPVYVYNNPNFQGYPMSLNLLRRLKEEVGVGGIKDATFDIMAHANYCRTLKDDRFDVALGTEAMFLSARVLGCEAFIPGLGNAFPEICCQMYEEGMAGNYEKCRETQFKINELRDIMYIARSTQLAIYAMLELRGILKCYPRAPFIPAGEEEKAHIRRRLVACGML